MKALSLLSTIFAVFSAHHANAHEDRCEDISASVANAGFSDTVTVKCDDHQALIISNTYPDHELMTGIVGTNEQLAVPAEYAAPIILTPTFSGEPLTRDAALGVAVNGVPIYDYTAGGEMSEADLAHYQAQHDTVETQQLDICGGHAGRGDDYHYHAKPVCMIEAMSNKGDDAIIGWAFDGYPIYGDKNPDGSEIKNGDLDICNGQIDATYGYRYHSSQTAPYIVQCLMGEVANFDKLPRVSPLKAITGETPQAGRPPRDGVDDLIYIQNSDGTRSMEYDYKGESYYMRYQPSENENCFDFETKTITNNGELYRGELCR